MESIHNNTAEMIDKLARSRCLVVLSDQGVCYMYRGSDTAISDTLAKALDEQEFSQYLATAIVKAGNV